jgi:hypothetical protein
MDWTSVKEEKTHRYSSMCLRSAQIKSNRDGTAIDFMINFKSFEFGSLHDNRLRYSIHHPRCQSGSTGLNLIQPLLNLAPHLNIGQSFYDSLVVIIGESNRSGSRPTVFSSPENTRWRNNRAAPSRNEQHNSPQIAPYDTKPLVRWSQILKVKSPRKYCNRDRSRQMPDLVPNIE